MTLTLDLKPETEEKLQQEAARHGLDMSEYAVHLIESHLPDAKNIALANLMRQWIEEDATDDEEELARRDAEWEELKANLNANRAATGERLLFP